MERNYTNGAVFKSMVIVAPNGNYVCDCTNFGKEDLKWYHIEGKWEIKDDVLIDTMMKHSNTNAHLPSVSHAKIVRFDTNELALRYEFDPSNYLEAVFIKYNGN